MIIFIADFFIEQVNGGGELANEEVIKMLKNNNFEVVKKQSHEISKDFLKEASDNFFIVANFVNLKAELLPLFKSLNYVIYEHDHKYTTTRNPSVFKDHFVPYENLINKDFYKNAKAVLCQSKIHAEVAAKNLLTGNIINLGCSLWSDEILDHIESLISDDKTDKHSIVRSTNKIKGTFEAILYCREHELEYDLIESADYKDFLQQLSQNKNLVFFPKTLETFCRLVVEARMLGCKVITNENIGATSEPWFELKGEKLIKFIRKEQNEVYKTFLKLIKNKKINYEKTPTIPKISIVTSVYDADDFIEGFLEDITRQTIFDNCELVLVNANSPGNEGPIIKEYVKKHKNIIYIQLDSDPGVYGAWNIGIKASSGKFITNANVDDRRAPSQLEILARELVNSTDVDLVYSQCFITSEPNETYETNSSKNRVYAVDEYTKENMIKCLPGCMPLWRKNLHDNVGYFNEKYKHAGDWDMWLAFIEGGRAFKKVSGVHGLYYHNPKGLSTSVKSHDIRLKEEREIFFKYKNIFGKENFNRYRRYFEKV